MTVLLAVLMIVLWLTGFALLLRVPLCSSGFSLSPEIPLISIIIPARNEEANVPRLIHSLQSQSLKAHEILVVDDHSDDNTARIAQENNVRLISSAALPSGWLGKPWACHQGAHAARGNIFVFLDADTFFEEGVL
mgnify:FL=1